MAALTEVDGLISIGSRQGDKYNGTITIRVLDPEHSQASLLEITVGHAEFTQALTGHGFRPCKLASVAPPNPTPRR